MTMQNVIIDGNPVNIFPKLNIDHKDFDKTYLSNKLKNESKIIDEIS